MNLKITLHTGYSEELLGVVNYTISDHDVSIMFEDSRVREYPAINVRHVEVDPRSKAAPTWPEEMEEALEAIRRRSQPNPVPFYCPPSIFQPPELEPKIWPHNMGDTIAPMDGGTSDKIIPFAPKDGE